MGSKRASIINILCSLSKVLYGNRDLIEYIYRKKEMIEKNETMLYYLFIGLQSGRIYSYTIYSFRETVTILYEALPTTVIPPTSVIHTSGEKRINEYKLYERLIPERFLRTFMLNKVHYHWKSAPLRDLKNDKNWCQKIILDALFIPNFIFIKKNQEENIFEDPSLKQKIRTLHFIIQNRGILYLKLIKEEFKEGDFSFCIILKENGTIESIYNEFLE
tara:strand:+ start:496 stop:1149 length:654 start_codon:yes stop_codon:yes gene_type:complete